MLDLLKAHSTTLLGLYILEVLVTNVSLDVAETRVTIALEFVGTDRRLDQSLGVHE